MLRRVLIIVTVLTQIISRRYIGGNLDIHPAYNISSLVLGNYNLKGSRYYEAELDAQQVGSELNTYRSMLSGP